MIGYENDGTVASITFNNPNNGNRITYQMMTDYIGALQDASVKETPFLKIQGAGDHFTCGRDQNEKVDVPRRQNLGLILRANDLLRKYPGVSISLIRGRAMGFGSGIALHSSISIAEDSATFGFDEIKHGLAPLIVVLYLPYFIGAKAASELCLTGRDVSAVEARQLGLVNRLVPEGQLESTAENLIASLGEHHLGALRLIRDFSHEAIPYPSAELGTNAVDRLASWIDAGKPMSLGGGALKN